MKIVPFHYLRPGDVFYLHGKEKIEYRAVSDERDLDNPDPEIYPKQLNGYFIGKIWFEWTWPRTVIIIHLNPEWSHEERTKRKK